MKTIEYRTIDKSSWGDGPWQSEPDKRQWQDEATGLPCLIVRGQLGALCGYVGVTKDHPLFGLDYNNDRVIYALDVHGGITFSNSCDHGPEDKAICHIPGPGEPNTVFWFGFDCGHWRDLMPARDAMVREAYRQMGKPRPERPAIPEVDREVYRDFAYVTAECASLAKQLAAIK